MLTKLDTPLERCNLKFQDTVGPDQVQTGLFEGYASVFGGIDSMGDTIMKGAFEETINPENRERPVAMLANHSARIDTVIGKWLELAEDDTGLYCQGELTPGHSGSKDVYASMKHGAISGLSIGFRVPVGGAEEIEGGGRRISKINLVEISVVTFPADTGANIQIVKSEIDQIESLRDCELFLRDVGLSQSMAKAFISQCRPLYQREVDQEQERKEAQHAANQWLHGLTHRGL